MEKLENAEIKEEKVETKQEALTPEDVKWLKHEFVTPRKEIVTEMDVAKLKASAFYQKYLTFLVELQKAIESKDITVTPLNPKFAKLAAWLDTLEVWISEIPPLQQKMRFGNTAFRTWHEKLQQNVDSQLEDILPEHLKGAVKELRVYVLDSFGSYERIDYGTGHELAFMMFLYILKEIGFYHKEDYESVVRNVFYRYIKLMRKLQLTYMLEPAGSHGVWGIDDYHFLPFLLGASELIKNPVFVTPDDINKQKLVDEYHEKYMYISCIKFIKEVKKGVPFHESSPILNDISAAESWNKVAMGMVKMYQAEVLQKHPVIKHSYYGSIITLEKAPDTK